MLCLPLPAFRQRLTDVLPHTPQQKHTSSGKSIELEANTEGSVSAAAVLKLLLRGRNGSSLLSCPLPSAALKHCPALPSNSSAALPISATRQTTCLTQDTSCSSDLTEQQSVSRSKCLNWWHNYNIRQHSGHATLGET